MPVSRMAAVRRMTGHPAVKGEYTDEVNAVGIGCVFRFVLLTHEKVDMIPPGML